MCRATQQYRVVAVVHWSLSSQPLLSLTHLRDTTAHSTPRAGHVGRRWVSSTQVSSLAGRQSTFTPPPSLPLLHRMCNSSTPVNVPATGSTRPRITHLRYCSDVFPLRHLPSAVVPVSPIQLFWRRLQRARGIKREHASAGEVTRPPLSCGQSAYTLKICQGRVDRKALAQVSYTSIANVVVLEAVKGAVSSERQWAAAECRPPLL